MRLPAKFSTLLPLLKVTNLESPGLDGDFESAGVGTPPRPNNQPQFLLQLDELRPRRLTPSYLFPKGTSTECQFATFFSLVGDRLFADGEIVATNEGTTHQPLLETPSIRAIDHGFSLEEGLLQWRHPSFANGKASFCLSASNTVLAVFNESSTPTDCVPANLVNVPYDRCFPSAESINVLVMDDDTRSAQQAAGSVSNTDSFAGSKWLDTRPDITNPGYGRASVGSYGAASVGLYSRPSVGSYDKPSVGSYGRPSVGTDQLSPLAPIDRASYNYDARRLGSTTPPSSVGYGAIYKDHGATSSPIRPSGPAGPLAPISRAG
ncbi:hypothetical protein TsFJ059_005405 [Trichoderma semiorbis]|uniref:DUF7908 domain-containing protein n=1 Tax=Trichoderma semiorbis TaxID=1491008 RepID=A0A9P8HNB5_9HYPO|nr:hypothetical protein TsFJ059_005405 [Trichoderma semiorbis]